MAEIFGAESTVKTVRTFYVDGDCVGKDEWTTCLKDGLSDILGLDAYVLTGETVSINESPIVEVTEMRFNGHVYNSYWHNELGLNKSKPIDVEIVITLVG